MEDFEREVLGRIPKNVPKVTWEVTKTAEAQVGSHAVIGKQLAGARGQFLLPGDQG